MPYKDPEKNRLSKQAFYITQRDAKRAERAAYEAAHPEETLEKIGQKWIATAIRLGNRLLTRPEYLRQWYATHTEKQSAYNKRYYLENKAAVTQRNAQWHAAHRPEIAAYKAQWCLDNQARLKQNAAIRYLLNRTHVIAKTAAWIKEHPEEVAVYRHRRRARLQGNGANDLTGAQWKEILAVHRHRCAYCGTKPKKGRMTMDHITPLSRGGEHTAANVIPACRSCNGKKHVHGPLIPVQPLLFTLAPSRKPRMA